MPTRRFAVRQGAKTRLIGDYSIFGQNSCTTVYEKVDVSGIDAVVNLAKAIVDGAVLESGLGRSPLSAKLWDLSSAFRQLGRHPCHAHIAIVSVWNPADSRVQFYEQLVLPFGATAAVYNLNWVARGLWWILVNVFTVFTTLYFDDFSVFESTSIAQETQSLIVDFFSLLGWPTKEQKPFADIFEPLGVVASLQRASEGVITVSNKEGF